MNGDTPQPKKRNWIAIGLGVLAIAIFAVLVLGDDDDKSTSPG